LRLVIYFWNWLNKKDCVDCRGTKIVKSTLCFMQGILQDTLGNIYIYINYIRRCSRISCTQYSCVILYFGFVPVNVSRNWMQFLKNLSFLSSFSSSFTLWFYKTFSRSLILKSYFKDTDLKAIFSMFIFFISEWICFR